MFGNVKWWLIALVLLVPVIGLPLLWNEIQCHQDVAVGSTCSGHLSLLSVGLHNYHAGNGHFPPAYILGPDGKPWHSWRVLILPFIEQQRLYNEYNFDEPWDGPNNRKLASR